MMPSKKKVSLLLLFIFLFSQISWALGPGDEAFQEGLRLKAEGSFKEAAEEFKRALTDEPTNPDYHFELANVYALLHDQLSNEGDDESAAKTLNSAANELEQAVMIRPEFIAARFNLGVIYKRQGKYEEARVQFRKVLDQDPGQLSALLQVGSTYEEQGFYDEAESVYDEARDRSAEDPGVQAALEDLKRRRFAEKERQMQNPSSGFGALNSLGSQMAQPSLFSQQPRGYGTAEQNPQGGLGQAIPALGSLLIQQLTKGRSPDQKGN